MLTLEKAHLMRYAPMKEAHVEKFGLTPEKYHLKFRESQKQSQQSWVDFVDSSSEAR